MSLRFQDIDNVTSDDVEAAIRRNDPDELKFVPITLALTFSDVVFVQNVCIKLCAHGHCTVRGYELISLGHLARRFRTLDEIKVKPLIESALLDEDEEVRVLAKSASDEIYQFLHWKIAGHVYG